MPKFDDYPAMTEADISGNDTLVIKDNDTSTTRSAKLSVFAAGLKTLMGKVSAAVNADNVPWSGVSGKPTLGDAAAKNTGTAAGTVAAGDHTHTSGQISGLATVASTGSYSDLSNRPSLGDAAAKNTGTAAGTVAAGNHTHAAGSISGLAAVATSGSYADLSGKPALGDAAAKNTGSTAGTVAAGDHTHSAGQISGLATVASTGTYSDLSGRPTLGDAAAKNTGTGAGTVAAGNHSHSAMTGATSTTAGAAGFVPAPAAGDQAKFLTGAGTYAAPPAGTGSDAATLNGQAPAFYLARGNHSGTQAASTITGLATVATSGSYGDLTMKPAYALVASTGLYSDLSGLPSLGDSASKNVGTAAGTVAAGNHSHSAMTGATSGAAGAAGFVPAPAAGDQNKFLTGAGTWQTAAGGTTATRGRVKAGGEFPLGLPDIEFAATVTNQAFPTANTVYYQPFVAVRPWTFDQFVIEIMGAASGGTVRLGLYNADFDFAPGALVVDGGTVDSSSTGIKTASVTVGTLPAGCYLIAVVPTNAQLVRFWRGGQQIAGINPVFGSTPYVYSLRAAQSASTPLPATGPAITSVIYNTSVFAHYALLRYSYV